MHINIPMGQTITHTETTELKTQLYKMTNLRNKSWLPMVCLRNNSCDLT